MQRMQRQGNQSMALPVATFTRATQAAEAFHTIEEERVLSWILTSPAHMQLSSSKGGTAGMHACMGARSIFIRAHAHACVSVHSAVPRFGREGGLHSENLPYHSCG